MSRPNASQMTVACHPMTVTARSLAPAVRCRLQGLHPRSMDIGAPASSRRAGARNPNTSECTCIAIVGERHGARRKAGRQSNSIPIARCRELLGDEAEALTDQEVALIRRHAETMAWMVVEMYLEHSRIPE